MSWPHLGTSPKLSPASKTIALAVLVHLSPSLFTCQLLPTTQVHLSEALPDLLSKAASSGPFLYDANSVF